MWKISIIMGWCCLMGNATIDGTWKRCQLRRGSHWERCHRLVSKPMSWKYCQRLMLYTHYPKMPDPHYRHILSKWDKHRQGRAELQQCCRRCRGACWLGYLWDILVKNSEIRAKTNIFNEQKKIKNYLDFF